jgi:colicin import membrane protein
MLNHLKKFFNQEEEEVNMTTETVPVAEANADVAALAAELSEMKASFAQVSETLAATKADLEKAQAALAAVAEEKAAVEAAAIAAKLEARRKEVEAQMGTEKAAAFMAATEGMDDAKVESFLQIFATNAVAEAKSEMFNEVGVETKADAKEEPKVTHFKQFIKGNK